MTCPRCGAQLPEDHGGQCPACGADFAGVDRLLAGKGVSTPGGYALSAIVAGVLAVIAWSNGWTILGWVAAGWVGCSLLIAVIGRGVQVGQRRGDRDQ